MKNPLTDADTCQLAQASKTQWENSGEQFQPKREVVLNGFLGPELDFGGSKIRTDSQGPVGSILAKIWPSKIDFGNPQGYIPGLFSENIEF